MIIKYVFKIGATNANILVDVCKLIAGGALVDCSADCDKVQSTVTGIATGWQVDDLAYGVVSSATLGGARKIFQWSIAANVLKAAAVESWNAGTHAGVNVCTPDGAMSVLSTSAGTLYIVATPDGVALYDGAANFVVLGELIPLGKLIDGGRPVSIVMSKAVNGRMPRVKNYNAAGDFTNYIVSVSVPNTPPMAQQIRGDAEALYYQTQDYIVSIPLYNIWIGKLRGGALLPNVALTGDTFSDDAGGAMVAIVGSVGNTVFGLTRA